MLDICNFIVGMRILGRNMPLGGDGGDGYGGGGGGGGVVLIITPLCAPIVFLRW